MRGKLGIWGLGILAAVCVVTLSWPGLDTGYPMLQGRPEHSKMMTGKCWPSSLPHDLTVRQIWGREGGIQVLCLRGHRAFYKQEGGLPYPLWS